MDVLYAGVVCGFCLVSSDSDFTRLATRIRDAGMEVYGFWERHPPEQLLAACDKFICPAILRQKPADSQAPAADTIKVLTMHSSKGLEFPVVALVGVGHMPAANQDEKDEARLFYVGATRATQRLIIGLSGDGQFGKQLSA